MAHKSKIEWTEATWNPWHGCHKVSQGCKNCYMFRDKARYGQDPNVVVRAGDKTFYAPLKWTEPRTIFTCSWSDFFIEEADEWRDEAFAIMALTPQHTYQVLTKRPERILEYFRQKAMEWTDQGISEAAEQIIDDRFHDFHDQGVFKPHLRKAGWLWDDGHPLYDGTIPLPNVWLGVSVEDQKTADERIPHLLNTPAAVRWISYEPALGAVNLTQFPVAEGVWANFLSGRDYIDDGREVVHQGVPVQHNKLDWIVVGGESGPNARPFDIQWARDVIVQCKATGVPVFVKQLGSNIVGSALSDDPAFPISESIRMDYDGRGVGTYSVKLKSHKGGDMSEWPEDLQVREFPK